MITFRRASFASIFIVVSLLVIGCGGSESSGAGSSDAGGSGSAASGGPSTSAIEKADHAGIFQLKADALEDAQNAVAKITDAASAKKAVPALNALADRLEKINARSDELGKPAAGSQGLEYGQAVMKMMNDFNDFSRSAMKFLDNEEIAAILDAPMQRIFDAYAKN